MSSVFMRALSPAVALMSASMSSSEDSSQLAHHSALLVANSLLELVTMIPQDYREVLRPRLVEFTSNVEKRNRMHDLLAKLVDLKGRDPVQFPVSISTNVHKPQLTKEFASTESGKQFIAQAAQECYTYKVVLLDNDITTRHANIAQLDKALTTSSFYDSVKDDLAAHHEVLLAMSKIPLFKDGVEPGETVLSGWGVAPTIKAGYLEIQVDCVAFALQALSLVEARDMAARSKLDCKKDLKEAADVEMADATKPGLLIQSMVDKAVLSAVEIGEFPIYKLQ